MSMQRLGQARKMQEKMANLLRIKYHELTLLTSIKISYNSGGYSGNKAKLGRKCPYDTDHEEHVKSHGIVQ